MFTTHLKLKNTGWEACTPSAYAQIYAAFGGVFAPMPAFSLILLSVKASGLCLAVVKAIVLAHGGKVSCEKNELNGTRFSFWLPQAKVSQPG